MMNEEHRNAHSQLPLTLTKNLLAANSRKSTLSTLSTSTTTTTMASSTMTAIISLLLLSTTNLTGAFPFLPTSSSLNNHYVHQNNNNNMRSSRSTSQQSLFCQNINSNINQVYNIGPDIYLALNSRSIFRFNVQRNEFDDHRYDINQLFGKNNFKWVDTVISLDGLCRISNLCQAGDNDLERIHVVIGNRILQSNGDRFYGLALYEQTDDGQIRILDHNSIDSGLLYKLNQTAGINVNILEQDGSIMMGSFWPSPNGILSGNLYYRSGLFVPFKSEVFFSIYDTNDSGNSQRVIHRRLTRNHQRSNGDWENLNAELDGGKYFIGMFNYVPKNRVFGLTKDNRVMEFVWTQDGKIKFLPMPPIRELLNCYGNSTELNKDPSTLVADTTTTTTTTPMPTTTTTTTMAPSPSTTTTLKPTQKTEKPTNLLESVPSTNDDINKDDDDESDEIPVPEDEPNLNDLDHQRDDPNNPHLLHSHHHTNQLSADGSRSSVAPSLAEASARGPFYPHDDGLIWTFTILVTILIILIIVILVPILVIRHRSRKNEMYLNKTTNGNATSNSLIKKNGKKNKHNGLDQTNCSEAVQLMNASHIEK